MFSRFQFSLIVGLLAVLLSNSLAVAAVPKCGEDVLSTEHLRIKKISEFELKERGSPQLEWTRNGNQDELLLFLRDKAQMIRLNTASDTAAIFGQRTLGNSDLAIQKLSLSNTPDGSTLVMALRAKTRTLEVEDLFGAVQGLNLAADETVRHWQSIETGGKQYLVVATAMSIYVFQRLENGTFNLLQNLLHQRMTSLLSSLELLEDGKGSFYVLGKGDLRVHVLRFDQKTLSLQIEKQIVQLGGNVSATINAEGDLVFASIDKLDRSLSFYSLKDNFRSNPIKIEGDVGHYRWLKLVDGKVVFAINSGTRAASELSVYNGQGFGKIETMSLQQKALSGSIGHLSNFSYRGRDYFVFSQKGQALRLLNHVDEEIERAPQGMEITDVTAPYLLKDGRMVIAMVSTGLKKSLVQVFQLGE